MRNTRALLSGGPADGRLMELHYPPMRYQYLQIPIQQTNLYKFDPELEPPQEFFAHATYQARGVDLNRTVGWHVLYEFVK